MDLRMIDKLRKAKPLVHHITNNVSVNECANTTLNLGALPVMAYAPQEVEEMVSVAGALVLNIGTLSVEQISSMIKVGKRANELGVPVILDPVGAGATTMRTGSAREILENVKITVIKGNAAEVSILAGISAEIKGVESLGVSGDIKDTAKMLADKEKCIVVVSGREDIATNGKELYIISNGHELMSKVVGTGCMAASAIGAFLGLKKDTLESTVTALASYEIAAEIAAERPEVKGPGSFKSAFMDEMESLTGETVEKRGKIKKI